MGIWRWLTDRLEDFWEPVLLKKVGDIYFTDVDDNDDNVSDDNVDER